MQSFIFNININNQATHPLFLNLTIKHSIFSVMAESIEEMLFMVFSICDTTVGTVSSKSVNT